ncbi:MAG: class I SAM-dependent methyltransferase [Candidatus Omnitrophota bacterium]
MKDIFDRYSAKYDAWYDRNKFAYLSELEAVKRFLPKKGKGLEIGVGTGRFAAPLGIEYGIDPSKNMLEIARRRGVNVRKSSGERLPFKKGTFDHVAVIVTLSFVRNPGKVLKEAARVLKRNGIIIIGMIDRDSFLGEYYRRKKGVFYSKAKLLKVHKVTELLIKAGFGGISYGQTIFFLPGKMRSIHRTRKGSGKGGFVVIKAEKRTK